MAIDLEVAIAVREAAETFGRMGAIVEEISFDPDLFRSASQCYLVLRCVMQTALLRHLPVARQALMDPDLLASCKEHAFDVATYVDAEHERRLVGSRLNLMLDRHDILLCPTIHTLPEPVDAKAPEPLLTAIFNTSRHPALSIPCGLSAAGLPIGLQLVAAHYQEARLLRAAAAFEVEHGFPKLPIGEASTAIT